MVQEVRNTVGNVPLEWYDEYPHLGYDLEGKAIGKPAKRDEVSHTHWAGPVVCLGVAGGVSGSCGGPSLLEECEGQSDRERSGPH